MRNILNLVLIGALAAAFVGGTTLGTGRTVLPQGPAVVADPAPAPTNERVVLPSGLRLVPEQTWRGLGWCTRWVVR